MIDSFDGQILKDVLMDPKGYRVKEPYYIINGSNEGTMTVLTAGKNGDEYNKTYGQSQSMLSLLNLHCLFGQGLLMMQRQDETGQVKEIKLLYLRPGTNAEIPSGYIYCLINTGSNFLVTVDNSVKTGKTDVVPENIKTNHGLAYYVVEKRGEIGFEKNPNYSFVPPISMD